MLDDLERSVLDFAHLSFRHPRVRDAEIDRRFGWSPTQYLEALNALIDNPDAQVYDWRICRRYWLIRQKAALERTAHRKNTNEASRRKNRNAQ